jgi:tetratricopeptide (TPR) repeat protein
VLAARAVLADAMMREEPCLACLEHAGALARRAIAADPKMPEGHIYVAAAIGYEARIVGDMVAESRGYAGEAKRHIDAALASNPNDPWALAAMGSWHIEIVHSAGPAIARWLFGAKFETGREYYEKAFAVADSNPVLRYQYALALSAYDLETWQKTVRDQLARAIAATPASSYEAFVHQRAQKLLALMQAGSFAEARRMVRHDQGYPGAL